MPEKASKSPPQGHYKGASGSPQRRRNILQSYHDLASTLFTNGSGSEVDQVFLDAAKDGDFERIDNLLKRRSDGVVNVDVKDKETGNTALLWAAKRGHIKIIHLLLKSGADITLRNYDGQSAVEVASNNIKQLLLDSVDRSGSSHRHLLQAAWQGDLKVLRKLLSDNKVLDINCRNADGLTPLLLVTRDADLFEKLSKQLDRGYKPLEVVKELMKHRVDPNAPDNEGRTALHYASSSKAAMADRLVELLLVKGASDLEARDKRFSAPIHCASKRGNIQVVVALLRQGSDVNTRGFAGVTPLHISASSGHEHVAVKLLEHGADVTLVDDSGLTPVDVAKNKRVKTTLRQAWAEATQDRIETTLAPVRVSSSDGLRLSQDEPTLQTPKKRKGEVVFETSQILGGSNMTISRSNLLKQIPEGERGRFMEDQKDAGSNISTPRRGVLGHRKLDLSSNVMQLTCRTPYTLEKPPRSPEKPLLPLQCSSPRKTPKKLRKTRSSEAVVLENGHVKLAPKYSEPLPPRKLSAGSTSSQSSAGNGSARDSGIPIAVLGLDVDERYKDKSKGKRGTTTCGSGFLHKGGAGLYSPSLSELSQASDELYIKGHSTSRVAATAGQQMDDLEELLMVSTPRLSPLRTPSAGDRSNRLRIPKTIQEDLEARRYPYLLDLDQMQLTNKSDSPLLPDMYHQHPLSRKVLPPTPTFSIPKSSETSSGFSSKESSPRSDDGIPTPRKRSKGGEIDLTFPASTTFNIQDSRIQELRDSDPGERSGNNSSSGISITPSSLSSTSLILESQNLATPKSTPRSEISDELHPRISPRKSVALPSKKELERESAETPHENSVNLSGSSSQVLKETPSGSYENKSSRMLARDFEDRKNADPVSSATDGTQGAEELGKQREEKKVVNRTASVAMQQRKQDRQAGAKLRAAARQNAANAISGANSARGTPCKASLTPGKIEETKAPKVGKTHTTAAPPSPKREAPPSPSKGKIIVHSTVLTEDSVNNDAHNEQPSQVNVQIKSENVTCTKRDENTQAERSERKVQKVENKSSQAIKLTNVCAKKVTQTNMGKSARPSPQKKDATIKPTPPLRVKPKPPLRRTPSQLAKINGTILSGHHRNEGATVAKDVRKEEVAVANENSTVAKEDACIAEGRANDATCERVNNVNEGASNVHKGTSDVHKDAGKGTSDVNESASDVNKCADVTNEGACINKKGTAICNSSKGSLPMNLHDNINHSQETPPTTQDMKMSHSLSAVKPSTNESLMTDVPRCNSKDVLKKNDLIENATISAKTVKPVESASSPVLAGTSKKNSIPLRSSGKSSGNKKSCQVKSSSSSTESIKKYSVHGSTGPKSTETKQDLIKKDNEHMISRNGSNVNSCGNRPETLDAPPSPSKAKSDIVLMNGKAQSLLEGSPESPRKSYSMVENTDENAEGSQSHRGPQIEIYTGDDQTNPNAWKAVNINILEHTPVIEDAFEHYRKEEPGLGDTPKVSPNKPKTRTMFDFLVGRGIKDNLKGKQTAVKVTPKKNKTPGNANPEVRQGSGNKKKKLKGRKTDSDSSTTCEKRPKSGKPKKMSKKKRKKCEVVVNEKVEEDSSTTAFISGIGWHIKTDCNENQDVEVSESNLGDSSEEEEEIMKLKNLDIIEEDEPEESNTKCDDVIKNTNNTNNDEFIVEHFIDDIIKTIITDSVVEEPSILCNENGGVEDQSVTPRSNSQNSGKPRERKHKKRRSGPHRLMDTLLQLDTNLLSTKDDPTLIPQTLNAIREFASAVKDDSLDKLLGFTSESSSLKSSSVGSMDANMMLSGGVDSNTFTKDASLTVVSDVHVTEGAAASVVEQRNQYNSQKDRTSTSRPSSAQRAAEITEKILEFRKENGKKSLTDDAKENMEEIIAEILQPTPDIPKWAGLRRRSEIDEGRFSSASVAKEKVFQQVPKDFQEKESPRLDSSGSPRSSPNYANSKDDATWTKINSATSPEEKEKLAKIFGTFCKTELFVDKVSSKRTSGSSPNLRKKPPASPIRAPSTSTSPRLPKKKTLSDLKNRLDSEKNTAVKDTDQMSEMSGTNSDVLSDWLSIPASVEGEGLEEGVKQTVAQALMVTNSPDSRTYTSRLGRRSVASSRRRCSSVLSTASRAPSEAPSDVGDTIEWKKGNILGRGAFGTVWCGLTNKGELIAVKQIELNVSDFDKAEREYEKIQEEVDLLKTLKHKNIVGYLGTSLEDNHVVNIFMQFIPGGSIANLLARFGALEEAVFRHYTKQILEGVEYLHSNNVIHRDIKGGNIMLMPNGVIKLIDFGCAKRLCINLSMSQTQILKSMRGTPYWMAPEVVTETGHGKKSDIWSTGCTVFEMATRKPPWAEMPPMTAIFAIGSDKPVPQLPEDFSKDARNFVNHCLTREPSVRHSATQLLQHAFLSGKRR